MRTDLIDPILKTLSINQQLQLLQVSKNAYYYEPVKESEENLKLLSWLDKQYYKTPFYGKRRLMAELNSIGYNINIKRLERLMKIVCWKTLYAKPRLSSNANAIYKYPYLLKGLKVHKPNMVWCIDITFLPMATGYLYMFGIIDLYSRYLVGWDISNSMTAEWCCDIISRTIASKTEPIIINSDQGSQFTSQLYTELISSHGIQISMDSKGRALDNIFIERFWRSLKQECYYLNVPKDGLDMYELIKKYVKFYNDERRHQSLNYETPLSRYGSSA